MSSALDRDIAWLKARLDEVLPPTALERLAVISAAASQRMGTVGVSTALEQLTLEEIHTALKILAIRFHLRNKAEQVHIARVNRRREREVTPEKSRPESLDEAVASMHREGTALHRLCEVLSRIDIQPTLTAHPTESRRRSVMQKQRRIGDLLAARDLEAPTPVENARTEGAVRQTLSLLMATDEVRVQRLDVIDEIRNGMHYLAGTIWDVVPTLYRDLSEAVERHYGIRFEAPVMLRYRSWIGGDRDGNPNVTAELTRRTFSEMRSAAIERHTEALENIRRELSVSGQRAPILPRLLESIAQDEQIGALDPEVTRHLKHEPFRVKILHMQAKLGRPEYCSSDFITDLLLLRKAAAYAGMEEVASCGLLSDAIVRARTFGFHLAALDIRQHSRIHEAAVTEMLRLAGVAPDYAGLDEPARVAILRKELASSRPLLGRGSEMSAETRELLATMGVLKEAVERDPGSVGSYIVSMAHQSSDLLEVLILMREVGLWRIDGDRAQCPIDVVPLFETVDDLTQSGRVMKELFAEPAYAAQLEARGRFQEIMLGYSDSSKDGGYWAANWGLYRAQDQLSRACIEAGVEFLLFHGRGGTVARGGGRAHRAILSSPVSSCNGRIRFTEQGEVISFRYAMPALAHRHLEQIMNAMIQATARTGTEDLQAHEMTALMDALAQASREAYRRLIDDPTFWGWFVEQSPVLHIGELPIASRPVSRTTGEIRFENLRAIPWVFAWTQMRFNAPGWYGIGSAFEKVVMSDPAQLERCRAAYHADGYFRAFIDNAQQEMARARLPVARWYSGGKGEAFFQHLSAEFAAAEQAILAITGQAALLDNNPVIQRSIRDRNPDTDTINALQVELLKRWRSESDPEQRSKHKQVILLSVNALAAAMQSTG